MKKIDLKEIQKILLDILIFFDKVCRENDIKYSLCAGTCLGAVRHKGFIPWDNDVDVMLDRENYNKFINVMTKTPTLTSKYKLLTKDNNPTYFYPFAKLIDTTTVLDEKIVKKIDDYGVYLDVFPIDGVPDDEKKRKAFIKKVRNRTEFAMAGNYLGKTWYGKLGRRLFRLLVLNKRWLMKRNERYCQKYPIKNCKYCSLLCWGEEIFETKCMYDLIEGEFCGHKFFIPRDYDSYLTMVYGDYMKLPPVEKRVSHEIEAFYKD